MSGRVGVALVGATGMWGPRLAEAIERGSRLRLVASCGRDGFEEAVAHPEAEAVVLATPNDVHAPQALRCAELGKHVLVEKPLADSVAAGEAMRDAFGAAGLVLAVGHGMRRLGAARRVKELLDGGELGTVVLAEANWSLPGKLTPEAWRWYRDKAPGGPLLQLGIHHADTLASWLGPIRRSFGTFAHLATAAEIDDVGVVALEFESGTLATITGSYVSPRTFFLRLYGTKGVLDYEIDMSVWPRVHDADAATALTLRDDAGVRPIEFACRDPLVEELDEFGAAIRAEGTVETGPDEGLAALRAILDAVRA